MRSRNPAAAQMIIVCALLACTLIGFTAWIHGTAYSNCTHARAVVTLKEQKQLLLQHQQSRGYHRSLPESLHNAAFNESLGCWHVHKDPRGEASVLHVAAEVNFSPGPRWEEVQKAMMMTQSSNPGVHYVLVTSNLSTVQLIKSSSALAGLPLDTWYCPDVLYGTPIGIGNMYKGTKFACSVDNYFPTFNLECKFNLSGQPIVYVMQRSNTVRLAGSDRSCKTHIGMGSADGIMYDNIPLYVTKFLRFPRTFWGCENLALFALRREGMKLVNLCPTYAPTHVHMGEGREYGRLRIDNGQNSVYAGDSIDITPLCTPRTSTNPSPSPPQGRLGNSIATE